MAGGATSGGRRSSRTGIQVREDAKVALALQDLGGYGVRELGKAGDDSMGLAGFLWRLDLVREISGGQGGAATVRAPAALGAKKA